MVATKSRWAVTPATVAAVEERIRRVERWEDTQRQVDEQGGRRPISPLVMDRWQELLWAKAAELTRRDRHDEQTYRDLTAGHIVISSQEDYDNWGVWAREYESRLAAYAWRDAR